MFNCLFSLTITITILYCNPQSWAVWEVEPEKQTFHGAAVTDHLLNSLMDNFTVDLTAISWSRQ